MSGDQAAGNSSPPRNYHGPGGSWRPSRAEGLARVLAKAGYGARPRTEALVRDGRVTVNGEVELDPGRAVDRACEIRLDGEILREVRRRYLALHKPTGVDCQPLQRLGRWIGDYLPDDVPGLEPVGRLDTRCRGLLLVSNDLDWNNRVAQDAGLNRRYEIVVSGRVSDLELEVIRAGMNLPGQGHFKPLQVRLQAADNRRTVVDLILRGGHLRQVRAVFTMLQHEVTTVVCTAIGPVDLDGLTAGAVRRLSPDEMRGLAAIKRNE